MSDFVAWRNLFTLMTSALATAAINLLVNGFNDATAANSYFCFYKYGPQTPGKHYPDTDRNAVDLVPSASTVINPSADVMTQW